MIPRRENSRVIIHLFMVIGQLYDEVDMGISPMSIVRDERVLGALHLENVPRDERS